MSYFLFPLPRPLFCLRVKRQFFPSLFAESVPPESDPDEPGPSGVSRPPAVKVEQEEEEEEMEEVENVIEVPSDEEVQTGGFDTDFLAFLRQFTQWLTTDEGGSNSRENAMEYGRKIKRMSEYGMNGLNDLCDRNKINKLFQEMPNARSFKPGTTASYVVALRMLVRYALLEDKVDSRQHDIAMTTTSFIRKSVNTKRKVREAELEDELDEQIIGDEEINVSLFHFRLC